MYVSPDFELNETWVRKKGRNVFSPFFWNISTESLRYINSANLWNGICFSKFVRELSPAWGPRVLEASSIENFCPERTWNVFLCFPLDLGSHDKPDCVSVKHDLPVVFDQESLPCIEYIEPFWILVERIVESFLEYNLWHYHYHELKHVSLDCSFEEISNRRSRMSTYQSVLAQTCVTYVALKWFYSTVQLHMSIQKRNLWEWFVTLLTFVASCLGFDVSSFFFNWFIKIVWGWYLFLLIKCRMFSSWRLNLSWVIVQTHITPK